MLKKERTESKRKQNKQEKGRGRLAQWKTVRFVKSFRHGAMGSEFESYARIIPSAIKFD